MQHTYKPAVPPASGGDRGPGRHMTLGIWTQLFQDVAACATYRILMLPDSCLHVWLGGSPISTGFAGKVFGEDSYRPSQARSPVL